MSSLRVIFLGNDRWSAPTLEAIAAADDIEVALVITNPARPAGRGSRLTPTAVAEAGRRLGLDVLETGGVRSGAGHEAIERLRPDVLVVVAYGEILTAEVLAIPRLGSLNLHFSLLPRWRGAAPVQRAILEGDEITGVSVMLLDEGLDTGPVLASVQEPIRVDDDKASLGQRLAEMGAPLVVESLRSLEAGTAAPAPQDHDGVKYAAKLVAEERVIDWRDPADSIGRRVRAFAPAPGATTTFRGAPLKVLRVELRRTEVRAAEVPTTKVRSAEERSAEERSATEIEGRAAGELRVDLGGTPTAVARGGSIALLEVAPAGRARMSGADWARGARLEREERLS